MKKKYLFIILFFSFLGAFFFLYKKDTEIGKILQTSEYSYLPKEAKNYIEKVYQNTGNVILTEKNKQENTPYLNPQYVEYLTLSQEESSQIGEIPFPYTIDYISSSVEDSGDIPSSYDVRNVNGKNFTTPLKDQKTTNICWAYTATEVAESYLLSHNNESYSSSSLVFSPMQLDYATSKNGIKDFVNDHGTRLLNAGGNFYAASYLMANGVAFVNEKVLPSVYTRNPLELYQVLNYNRALYDVESTVMMPDLENQYPTSDYLNEIKKYIMENGGGYVGSLSPHDSCSSLNNGSYLIRIDDSCTKNSGHAMQLIGWDDNYQYSYCKDRTNNIHNSNVTSCSSGNLVTGVGAFLLRNSWGNDASYLYLAYDSLYTTYNFITGLVSNENKNWDNNYHDNMDIELITFGSPIYQTFEKKIDTVEKVQKVKFINYSQNSTYYVIIMSNNEHYGDFGPYTVKEPGIYTVDLSDMNILLTDSSFSVYVYPTTDSDLIVDSISVFTKNVDSNVLIEPKEKNFSLDSVVNGKAYRFFYDTKNIPSGENISFELINRKGETVNEYFSYSANIVARNEVNASIMFYSTIPNGNYTLRATYQGVSSDVSIRIGNTTAYVTTYYANNGTNDVINQNVDEGDNLSIIQNPFQKEGYHFVEWNTKSDGSGTSYQELDVINNVHDEINLYAIWSPNTYQVIFHKNDSTNTTTYQDFTYDEKKSLNENHFKRKDYHFVEWNTKSDGSGTSYNDLEEVLNLISTHQGIVDLFAIWESDIVSVTSVSLNKTSVVLEIGETYTLLPTILPNNATDKTITWSSSNPSIVQVENGIITALSVGKSTIKATSSNGKVGSCVVKVTEKEIQPVDISYTTHVENIGWQDYVSNGVMAGTSGKSLRLEGIKVKLENNSYGGDILYRTHIENIGWEDSFKENDAMSGTSGKALRLEAIEIKLEGEVANYYDVYYRVHAQNVGWMNWAKNGERAGTAGYAYRLEGIEIVLVKKGENPPNRSDMNYQKSFLKKDILYTTHVQNIGWQDYTYDGNMAGTSGQALRLEGIKIKLDDPKYSGNVLYRTHIQNIGWESKFKKNDEMSGTSGQALRLEAIEIKLDGEMANHYDIYYRVHAENFGWLAWAKNGERAGTAGYAYRLEGIEILLVEKGKSPPIRTNQNKPLPFYEKK